MKTLVIRELRQWWMVSLAGGVLLTLGLWFSLFRLESPIERPLWLGIETLLSGNVQGLLLVGSAILGLVLGFLTISADQHPDQWAFLVHRPISIRRIFWAKTLATTALLIVSMASAHWIVAFGLPYFEGELAPLDMGMLTPGLIDIASGVTYLFAGMLIGSREVRWHGTRLWPVFAAIVFSFFTLIVPSPEIAALTTVIGWLVLGSAALFNFEARGDWQGLTSWGKGSTAAMATVAGALVLLISGFACLIASALTDSSNLREWESYHISQQGGFNRIVHSNGNNIALINREGQRRNLSEGETVESVVGPKLDEIVLERSETQGSSSNPRTGFRDSRRYFWPLMRFGQELWYYRMSDGRIHGYDLRRKAHIGSFGPKGLAGTGQRVELGDRFESPSAWQTLSVQNLAAVLIASNEVYLISATDKSVRRVGTVPKSERVRACGGNFEKAALWKQEVRDSERTPGQNGNPSSRWIAYATDEATYLMDPNGKIRRVEATRTYGEPWELTVWVGQPDGSAFLQYAPRAAGGKTTNTQEGSNGVLLEVHSNGQVVSTQPLPRINEHLTKSNPLRDVVRMGVEDAILPPVIRAIFGFARGDALGSSKTVQIVSILTTAAAVILLGGMWGFERRETFGWLLAVGCMGPAALIAVIALRQRAVKEACSTCGNAEDVSHERCRSCGAMWKSTPQKGIEILRPTLATDRV